MALALLAAGLVGAFVPIDQLRRGLLVVAAILVLGLGFDLAPQTEWVGLSDSFSRTTPLALVGPDPVARALLLGALVWCGPAADLVVRLVLQATRLPAPEAAARAGFGAGRWIGRLERWMIVTCVAAGQPGLAAIPVAGKALFRYAEVVADARAARPRLAPEPGAGDPPQRDAIVDYVIVGSLTSWAQAIVLGLVAAGI